VLSRVRRGTARALPLGTMVVNVLLLVTGLVAVVVLVVEVRNAVRRRR
jgi:hypothetical protein